MRRYRGRACGEQGVSKLRKETLAKEGALVQLVKNGSGSLAPSSLARSYGLPEARITEILKMYGGL